MLIAVKIDVSVVKAIAAKPGRSRSKRPTNSAAKCWQSAAEPPLPHARILPPSVRQSMACSIAAAIGSERMEAAFCLAKILSSNCAVTRALRFIQTYRMGLTPNLKYIKSCYYSRCFQLQGLHGADRNTCLKLNDCLSRGAISL